MFKQKGKRALSMLLILLMVLNAGVGALAATDTQTEPERRHPDRTADEALLADYLAGCNIYR